MVRTSHYQCKGPRFNLVGDLRSHKPYGKKEKKGSLMSRKPHLVLFLPAPLPPHLPVRALT